MLASDDRRESVQAARNSAIDLVREAFLTGFAVMIPLLITLYVLTVAAGIIVEVLAPVEQGLRQLQLAPERANTLVRVMAVILLLLVTLLEGLFATFSAGREGMRTLFLPLAPNPVMGGFLAHVPEDQVMDVDMTVEEGIRKVVTTGVGVAQSSQDAQAGLTPAQMVNLNGHETTMANRAEGEADDD